jgi:hypothetical protein
MVQRLLGRELAAALSVVCLVSFAAVAEPLPDPLPCTACFVGTMKLVDNPADPTGKTKKLADDLYFVDPDKFVWKAGKDDITDGATIPELFQPIIGGPFEVDYLPAAVIHDHYTNKAHRVRPWRDTARVFYQAMIVKGINVIKAKTMYFAVYAFGPHWDVLAKGIPCGKNCLFSIPFEVEIASDKTVRLTSVAKAIPSDKQFAEEPADFRLEHAAGLKEIEDRIAASEIRGAPFSLDELDRQAELRFAANVFLATNRAIK